MGPEMTPRPIVIYGAGPFAAQMGAHFAREGGPGVAGFTVDPEFFRETTLDELPIVPTDLLAARFPADEFDLFLAIGYKRMREREGLFLKAKGMGYRLINFISRSALVSEPGHLGENNVILPGAILEPGVHLGDNNILWSGAIVCHDTRMGDHNFLAAGVIIGGECILGNKCFFGFGATVLDRTRIADETLAGARALILKDTEPCGRYLGVPAARTASHASAGIEILR